MQPALNTKLQLLERRLSTTGNNNSNSGLGNSLGGRGEIASPESKSKSASTLHLSHSTPPPSSAPSSAPVQSGGASFVFNTNSLYSSINDGKEGEWGGDAKGVTVGVTQVGFPPPMLQGNGDNSNSMSNASFSKDLVSIPLSTVQSVVDGHLATIASSQPSSHHPPSQVITTEKVGETPPEEGKRKGKRKSSQPRKHTDNRKKNKEGNGGSGGGSNHVVDVSGAKQQITFTTPPGSNATPATPTPTTEDDKSVNSGGKSGGGKGKSISDFFNTTSSSPNGGRGRNGNNGGGKDGSEKEGGNNEGGKTDAAEAELMELRSKVATLTSQIQIQTASNAANTKKLQEIIESNKRTSEKEDKNRKEVMEGLVRDRNARERSRVRQELALKGARLGTLKYERVGGGISGERVVEVWEDGEETRDLKRRKEELRQRRVMMEKRQKEAKKQVKKLLNHSKSNGSEMPPPPSKTSVQSCDPTTGGMIVTDDLTSMEAEESVKAHLNALKKLEVEMGEREKMLETEKVMHVRQLKRVQNEDASRFQNRPKLHDRYLLLNLLGKGGFSEVWRAHDMSTYQDVAVKIHQLDARWSEDKKRNYTKHVSREYEIHRDVRHPRIVSLLDVFEIDHNSFATVLEYCKGTDLDTMLKEQKNIPEREARAILLQVLTGMRYLNVPSPDGSRQGIIHYDLKPGNILFDEHGDAKITDFGLSKIVDTENEGDSLELTSQGAGTYWYLPPECFMTGKAVRISNKVDVWSLGVIYYQMLYGKRPFGDGQSQDRVLSNNLILNATEVKFPLKPQVSKEGKDFISEMLTHNQVLRPDITQLCNHKYLKIKGKL